MAAARAFCVFAAVVENGNMWMRWFAVAALPAFLVAASCLSAQTAPQPAGQASSSDVTASPDQPVPRTPEAPVAGLARVDKGTLALTLQGKSGAAKKLLLYDFEFEGSPVANDKLHLKQLSPGVLEITSVAYTVGEWRVRVHDSAEYYGLGEHFDTLNHAHTAVRNVSQDNPGTKGSSTYKPIPFFMSTTGYGIWFDTTGDATFDMNAANKEDIIVDADAEKLRIVLFAEREFPKILDSFTALAGRSILPPYWAFAPWLGRDYHQNETQVRQDADKARELGLPASVILIDSPWETGYNSYIFNPKQFADAPGMVKHLHDEGYKLVLWHTPWINVKTDPPGEQGFAGKIDVASSNYAEAATSGFFVKNPDGTPYLGKWWKGQGSLIDFTNAHAKLWWQDQVLQAIHAGADGFKDDDGEGSFIGEVKFADEADPRIMRNRYAVLYNNAMEELIQKDLKGNGVLFIRSATTGANGLGFLWGGDNQASFSPGERSADGGDRGTGRRDERHAALDCGPWRVREGQCARSEAVHALDRVRGVLSGYGSFVDLEPVAVGLQRQCLGGSGAGGLSQILAAAHESVSIPVRCSTGGGEDRYADHAGAGARVSG